MATASQVAKYIVDFFQQVGDPVTNLKLQKLLYYVQGWHLGLRGEPAFDDRIEAWVHGPVQPSVYREYSAHRWNPIVTEVQVPALPDDLKDLIADVLETYGADSGYELELRSHRETPWLESRGALPPDENSNTALSHTTMQRFFAALAADGEAQ
ncbi:MAG: Panacea domain-containing protein [Telluria sp.]